MLSFWHKYGEYRLDSSILLILEFRHWTRETLYAPQALAFRFPSANGLVEGIRSVAGRLHSPGVGGSWGVVMMAGPRGSVGMDLTV